MDDAGECVTGTSDNLCTVSGGNDIGNNGKDNHRSEDVEKAIELHGCLILPLLLGLP
jgi:hypothetical protein